MNIRMRIKQKILKHENEEFRIISASVEEVLDGEYRNKNITIKGSIPKLYKNETIIVEGTILKHAKYGWQLDVLTWERPVPQTKEQLIDFFNSPLFKGIGKKTAEKIVTSLGVKAISKIGKQGVEALQAINIKNEKKEEIVMVVKQTFILNDVIAFYNHYGVTAEQVLKVYSHCDNTNMLKDNPYLFAKYQVLNYSVCDQIAFKLGMFPHAHYRIDAMIYLLLKEVIANGDCYIEENKLLNKLLYLLNANKHESDYVYPTSVINVLETTKTCYVENGRVYPTFIYYAEKELAQEIVVRINNKYVETKSEFEISLFLAKNARTATDEQQLAVKTFIENNIMILNGEPGTGKTFVIDLILKASKELLNAKSIGLAAPTGRAAKRIAQSISVKAETNTLHRLLGYGRNGINDKPFYNEENKLPYDVVVVDEFSMVDTVLARNLLVALKPTAKLCICGDPEQLESVGAGKVLADLLVTNIKRITLTKIFRQAEQSKIIHSARKVKKGELIDFKNEGGQFFISSSNSQRTANLIVASVKKLINQFQSIHDIMVLAPMKKGILGIENLNELIRNAVNPAAPRKREIVYRNQVFRQGDKVMYTHNNPTLDVFNGDIGEIKYINLNEDLVTIDFDGLVVDLKRNELKHIILAYATSIHKSQGSQAKTVILVLANEHDVMLKRNLLFTAMTRAEDVLIMLGEEESYNKAILNMTQSLRKTTLTERILKANIISAPSSLKYIIA